MSINMISFLFLNYQNITSVKGNSTAQPKVVILFNYSVFSVLRLNTMTSYYFVDEITWLVDKHRVLLTINPNIVEFSMLSIFIHVFHSSLTMRLRIRECN